MARNWILKEKVPDDLCRKLDMFSTLAVQLLYNRGLVEEGEIQKFIEPKYEDLHDPFLFQDMQKAVDRIWQAIEAGEKICIYGDYDADAVTANAVLQQTFRYLGVEIGSYIPDRFTEGYGINLEALAKIRNEGCRVIITVDTGTNATDAAYFCAQNGIDLIITDHHEIIGEVPEAYALINPKNPGDTYPYHEITGVGVAFKLAAAILKNPKSVIRNPNHTPGWEKWLLDLVAIGTVADCHSLMGENRLLVKFGLLVLQKTKWTGLRAIIRSSSLDFAQREPDTYTLGFVIAPRLNAAGRLKHANVALDVLMETDPVLAQQRSFELETINQDRQAKTERMMSEARELALQYAGRKVLVLMKDDWNKGVVGLVAGKIAEEFHKPAIVLSQEGDLATGSARTVGGFNIIEALKYASDFMVRFGGHEQAAGLTLKTDQLENFYGKLLEYADKHLVEADAVLELEAEATEQDLNFTTTELLKAFEPFGVDNHKPKFLIRNLEILNLKTVGSASQHVQTQFKLGTVIVSSIAFNSPHFVKNFQIGNTVDVAAEIMEDGWNGRRSIKLRVVDMRNSLN